MLCCQLPQAPHAPQLAAPAMTAWILNTACWPQMVSAVLGHFIRGQAPPTLSAGSKVRPRLGAQVRDHTSVLLHSRHGLLACACMVGVHRTHILTLPRTNMVVSPWVVLWRHLPSPGRPAQRQAAGTC